MKKFSLNMAEQGGSPWAELSIFLLFMRELSFFYCRLSSSYDCYFVSGKNDTCRCSSGEIRSILRYVLLSPALQTKWVSEKPTLSQKIISNSVKRTIFTESTCFVVLVSLWTCDDIRCTVWVVYILTYARPRRWPAVPVNRQSLI